MSSIRISTGQHLRCVTGQKRNQRPENPHLTMLEGGKSRDEGFTLILNPETEECATVYSLALRGCITLPLHFALGYSCDDPIP